MIETRLFSRKDLLPSLFFLVLFLFVFKNFLFTDGIFFERDSTLLEIPARQLGVQLLREGNFALWTDAYGNGQPFLANPKNAVLYPGTWLYLALPFFAAFKLHYVLHFILGWLGVYYLGKAYSLSEQASFLGASVFLFSGVYLSSLEFYNHMAALSWMPWILIMLLRFRRKFWFRLAALAILWSLLILAGTPYVIIIAGCFASFQTLLVRSLRPKRFLLLTVSVILALCLSAAQLMPTADLYQSGVREQGTSALWSLEPLQLFNFVFPHILGDDRQPGHDDFWGSHLFERGAPLYYSLFLGFGVFILVFMGLKRPFDYRHYLFSIPALFFFVLALGIRTPFYPLWKWLPPFAAIRYPVKYLVPFTFCLAMLSAIGFDRLFWKEERSENKSIVLVTFSAVPLVLFFLVKSPLVEALSSFFVVDKTSSVADLSNSLFLGFFFLFVCGSAVYLSRLLPSKKRAFAWILLGVIILHPISVNRFINPLMSASSLKKPRLLSVDSEKMKDSVKIYRDTYVPFAFKEDIGGTEGMYSYFRETLFPYYGLQFGVKFVYARDFYNSYDADMSILMASLENFSHENKVKLFRSAGCDFILTHFPLPDLPSEEIDAGGYPLYKQDIPGPLPAAYLVYDQRLAESFEERLNLFQMADFNPEDTAIIGTDFQLEGIEARAAGDSVLAVETGQSRQRYQVVNARPALLVVQGKHSPGWKAWLNGRKTDVLKADLSAKAVFLQAGAHELTLKYYPAYFQIGLVISTAALILVFGTAVFYGIQVIAGKIKSQKKSY